MNDEKWSWSRGVKKAVVDSTDTLTVISFVVSVVVFGLVMGLREATVLLIGIALHELGHLVAAVRSGIPIGPTRFLPMLGGMAKLKADPSTGMENVVISLAGPVVGLMTAFVIMVLAALSHNAWLADAAVVQAGFNLFSLLPIFPLDGGRVAREVTQTLGKPAMQVHLLMSVALGILGAIYLDSPGFFIFVVLIVLTSWYSERKRCKALAMLEKFTADLAQMKGLSAEQQTLCTELHATVGQHIESLREPPPMNFNGLRLASACWSALVCTLLLVLMNSQLIYETLQ